VYSGIRGVLTKPFQGARDGGLVGLLKGTLRGGTGLIAKPISGTFEGVTLLSEGVKASLKSLMKFRPNSLRARSVRTI
jgi:hypothetical protein